jgi:hypothetical protein
MIVDDKDGVNRDISTRNYAKEINERYASCHRESKAHVLTMHRIGSSIAILEQPVGIDTVIVRPWPAFDLGNRGDRKRNLPKHSGSENSGLVAVNPAPNLEPRTSNRTLNLAP